MPRTYRDTRAAHHDNTEGWLVQRSFNRFAKGFKFEGANFRNVRCPATFNEADKIDGRRNFSLGRESRAGMVLVARHGRGAVIQDYQCHSRPVVDRIDQAGDP
jgi:hypothetical protein